MADTWYAWSNFPDIKKKVGDQVSQSDFEDMDDEEWDYLVDTGVVRRDPYPKIGSQKSPTEHMKEQIATAEGRTEAYVAEEEEAQPESKTTL